MKGARSRTTASSSAQLLPAACIAACFGCSSARLPARESLEEPCTVFLLQTPIHPILALPDERGRFVGYGFGDRVFIPAGPWSEVPWGLFLGFAGVPGELTAGAMERFRLRGATRDELARETDMEADELVVERARAEALRARLESKIGAPVDDLGWLFETDDRYSLYWDNCHSATAAWLRELGAEVPRFRLVPRLFGWRIQQ